MTSYFDALAREIGEAPSDDLDVFVETVRNVEARAFAQISLNTGDREFPDDLREKIMGAFAVQGIYNLGNLAPTEDAVWYVKTMLYSRALETVHSLFHELASRRIATRFGRLSDSPSQNLVLRDEYDEDRAKVPS